MVTDDIKPNLNPSTSIYTAVYSGVPVYELLVRDVAVMRRKSDGWVNATQILKVAGVDKGKRTKILDKEVLIGEHEKIQGGYGKYQGTWIPYSRGIQLAKTYGVSDILGPLFDFVFPAAGDIDNTPTKEQVMASMKRMNGETSKTRSNRINSNGRSNREDRHSHNNVSIIASHLNKSNKDTEKRKRGRTSSLSSTKSSLLNNNASPSIMIVHKSNSNENLAGKNDNLLSPNASNINITTANNNGYSHSKSLSNSSIHKLTKNGNSNLKSNITNKSNMIGNKNSSVHKIRNSASGSALDLNTATNSLADSILLNQNGMDNNEIRHHRLNSHHNKNNNQVNRLFPNFSDSNCDDISLMTLPGSVSGRIGNNLINGLHHSINGDANSLNNIHLLSDRQNNSIVHSLDITPLSTEQFLLNNKHMMLDYSDNSMVNNKNNMLKYKKRKLGNDNSNNNDNNNINDNGNNKVKLDQRLDNKLLSNDSFNRKFYDLSNSNDNRRNTFVNNIFANEGKSPIRKLTSGDENVLCGDLTILEDNHNNHQVHNHQNNHNNNVFLRTNNNDISLETPFLVHTSKSSSNNNHNVSISTSSIPSTSSSLISTTIPIPIQSTTTSNENAHYRNHYDIVNINSSYHNSTIDEMSLKEIELEKFRTQFIAMFLNDDPLYIPESLSCDPPKLSPLQLNTILDDQGHTSLHWAAALARIPIVRLLIQGGANTKAKNHLSETPLHRAVLSSQNYQNKAFKQLLNLLSDDIMELDNNGRSVLHFIVMNSASSSSSLNLSSVSSSNNSANLLLNEPNCQDYYLSCLLEFLSAIYKEMNSELNQDNILIEENISKSNNNLFNLLIKKYPTLNDYLNIRDKDGDTAINIAAKLGCTSLVSKLIEKGADPFIENYYGISVEDFGYSNLVNNKFKNKSLSLSSISSSSASSNSGTAISSSVGSPYKQADSDKPINMETPSNNEPLTPPKSTEKMINNDIANNDMEGKDGDTTAAISDSSSSTSSSRNEFELTKENKESTKEQIKDEETIKKYMDSTTTFEDDIVPNIRITFPSIRSTNEDDEAAYTAIEAAYKDVKIAQSIKRIITEMNKKHLKEINNKDKELKNALDKIDYLEKRLNDIENNIDKENKNNESININKIRDKNELSIKNINNA